MEEWSGRPGTFRQPFQRRELFWDIKRDTRHHNVAILYSEHVEGVSYPGWPLKFVDMNRNDVTPADWKIINTGIPEHLRLIMFGAL